MYTGLAANLCQIFIMLKLSTNQQNYQYFNCRNFCELKKSRKFWDNLSRIGKSKSMQELNFRE